MLHNSELYNMNADGSFSKVWALKASQNNTKRDHLEVLNTTKPASGCKIKSNFVL